MRLFIISVLVIAFLNTPAQAQLISEQPLCVTLYNNSENEILGHIETASYTDLENNISQHISGFKIAPMQRQDFCSTGPFFEGYKLRLVLKTSMPLYSCLIETGREITMSSERDETSGWILSADCPPE